MLLTHVTIRNFRGLGSLELPLSRTTLLIGENNCGKTSVLQAIRLALSRSANRKSGLFDAYDYHLESSESEPQSAPPIEISLKFETETQEAIPEELSQALSDVFQIDDNGRQFVWFQIKSEFSTSEGDFVSDWHFLNSAGLPLVGKATRLALLQDLQRYFAFFYLDALRDAAQQFRNGTFWNPFIKNPSIPEETRKILAAQVDELNRTVLAGHEPLRSLKTHLKKVQTLVPLGATDTVEIEALPSRLSDLLSGTQVSMSSSLGASIPLIKHGAGTQSLSVLFLFQAYLASILEKQNVAGAQPIVAIEEPEAHLHPFATRSLWNTIDALTGQKLVASHSGDLVANAPLESIRRLYVLNGETRVGLVPVNLLDSNEARKIRFHISNPRGELLFARCWLLVEGETEFWLLDGLARTTGRELDRWGIRIVQYTNSGAECLLKVANALGIPWFLLADGDGAGKKYIRTAGDHLNGVPAADCIVGLAEDNIECHLCSVGFESIFLNHVSPQKKGQVTGTAGSAEYWKQITKAGDDTPKPEVMREVIEAIRNGASPPPALIYVLDRALELAGAISNLTEEVPQ